VVKSAACGGVLVAVVLRQPLGTPHGATPEAANAQVEWLRQVLGRMRHGLDGELMVI
jgi:hypothetical protein